MLVQSQGNMRRPLAVDKAPNCCIPSFRGQLGEDYMPPDMRQAITEPATSNGPVPSFCLCNILMCSMLADAGIWVDGSSMFVPDCPYSERGLGGFRCLSAIGWLFTIFFTYAGFALLLVGEYATTVALNVCLH